VGSLASQEGLCSTETVSRKAFEFRTPWHTGWNTLLCSIEIWTLKTKDKSGIKTAQLKSMTRIPKMYGRLIKETKTYWMNLWQNQ